MFDDKRDHVVIFDTVVVARPIEEMTVLGRTPADHSAVGQQSDRAVLPEIDLFQTEVVLQSERVLASDVRLVTDGVDALTCLDLLVLGLQDRALCPSELIRHHCQLFRTQIHGEVLIGLGHMDKCFICMHSCETLTVLYFLQAVRTNQVLAFRVGSNEHLVPQLDLARGLNPQEHLGSVLVTDF